MTPQLQAHSLILFDCRHISGYPRVDGKPPCSCHSRCQLLAEAGWAQYQTLATDRVAQDRLSAQIHPRRIRLQFRTLPMIFWNCGAMFESTAQRHELQRTNDEDVA
jgi:hypothetical protein